MTEITSQTTLLELAAIVSTALEKAGIIATLSGGAAVSIYTDNRYESSDLDFVTVGGLVELAAALEPLGFKCTGKPRLSVFEHADTHWYIEFAPAPLSFGGTYISPSECAELNTRFGKLRIITATHSIMDRLAAASAWNEPQSLEQAVLVARSQGDEINWPQLDEWIANEDVADHRLIQEFFRQLQRPPK